MKAIDSITFFLAMGLFIIGINQAIVLGFAEAYWIFMASLILLFIFSFRKNQKLKQQLKDDQKQKTKKVGNKTKKR